MDAMLAPETGSMELLYSHYVYRVLVLDMK
jgi:hypothetical protein